MRLTGVRHDVAVRQASWCSLSRSGVVGVLGLGAVTLAGTACSDALTKGTREPAPSERASQVSLDLDLGLALERVSVARSRLDALSLRDDDRPMRAELLARALYAVALAHMARARELDRAVLQLAPPADRVARREGAAAEPQEAEGEAEGELPLARLVDELRPAARLQHLAPAARAHVRSHDAALLEAARLFRESRLMAPSTPRSGLGAAEARALERLGQRTRAREAWLAALSGHGAPADRFEAWVAFADHFEALGRVGERERALERAAIELGRVPSSERAAACLEARGHASHLAPALVCPAGARGVEPR